jgi:hypothetical protein
MTLVPSVTWGDLGFIAPSAPAVLAGVQADINAAFGRTLSYNLNTPQGQLATSEAAVIVDTNSIFVYYTNQVDPAYATGRMQDAIARIYFLERLPAQPTLLQLELSGELGVVVPEGATVIDTAGNLYQADAQGTFPSSGLMTIQFSAIVYGPTAVPDEVQIYQAVSGWDSATVTSGTVGQDTESRAQFETRRKQSVAANSVSQLNSVLGAVLSVDGVLDAYVTENDESSVQTVGGVVLAANSIWVAAVGGTDEDVARAIWSKKSPGCAYNGNTTVLVSDTNAGYNPPLPTYTILFERPDPLEVLFAVVLTDSPQVPSNAETLIRDAISAAFNGEDGGARARIGSTIYSSRFVPSVLALGSWVQLQSLLLGSPNNPGAVFQGSIAGTTLTVSSLASGALAVGQTVVDNADDIVAGTTILSQLSGTAGGIGTYQLSTTQTLALRQMKTAVPTRTSVSVQIDQTPQLNSANISVTLA